MKLSAAAQARLKKGGATFAHYPQDTPPPKPEPKPEPVVAAPPPAADNPKATDRPKKAWRFEVDRGIDGYITGLTATEL